MKLREALVPDLRERWISSPALSLPKGLQVNASIVHSPPIMVQQGSPRWNIEVDFRTIKATLEMDVLRCKLQPMMYKEIAVYFPAYNLVRWAMAKAALLVDLLPRASSFARYQASVGYIC